MINFKQPNGHWKPKYQIEKEVRGLENMFSVMLEALNNIKNNTEDLDNNPHLAELALKQIKGER